MPGLGRGASPGAGQPCFFAAVEAGRGDDNKAGADGKPVDKRITFFCKHSLQQSRGTAGRPGSPFANFWLATCAFVDLPSQQ
jgi:hypothetical protein